MVRACVVSSCTSGVKIPAHRFPKNAVISELWVVALKTENLKSIPSNERTKYRVCHKHFSDDAYIYTLKTRKLKKDALPTLNLPIENENIQHTENMDIDMLPTTSVENLEFFPDVMSLEVTEIQTDNINIMERDKKREENEEYNIQNEIREEIENVDMAEMRQRSPIPESSVSRDIILGNKIKKADLTPRAARLYKIVKNLQIRNRYYRKQNTQLKQRLKTLKYSLETNSLNQYKDLSKAQKILIQMQLRTAQQRPRVSKSVVLNNIENIGSTSVSLDMAKNTKCKRKVIMNNTEVVKRNIKPKIFIYQRLCQQHYNISMVM